MDCVFSLVDGCLICKRCNRIYPRGMFCESDEWPRWNCIADAKPIPKGPGDYLHDAIIKWVGEGPTRQCGCQDRINQMNAWGPAGCREHINEIADWLIEEANKRGWWKLTTIIPCSRIAVKQLLILPAIAKAEATEKPTR